MGDVQTRTWGNTFSKNASSSPSRCSTASTWAGRQLAGQPARDQQHVGIEAIADVVAGLRNVFHFNSPICTCVIHPPLRHLLRLREPMHPKGSAAHLTFSMSGLSHLVEQRCLDVASVDWKRVGSSRRKWISPSCSGSRRVAATVDDIIRVLPCIASGMGGCARMMSCAA